MDKGSTLDGMNVNEFVTALRAAGATVIVGHMLEDLTHIGITYPPVEIDAWVDETEALANHQGVWVRANGQVWVLAASGPIGYTRLDDGEVSDETTAALDMLGVLLAEPEPVTATEREADEQAATARAAMKPATPRPAAASRKRKGGN